jgi:hypothetical protein
MKTARTSFLSDGSPMIKQGEAERSSRNSPHVYIRFLFIHHTWSTMSKEKEYSMLVAFENEYQPQVEGESPSRMISFEEE